jgi:6,7-dimethyl-8-ribityllumazine synthase
VNQSRQDSSQAGRIAFIKAQWHADIVDQGYEGFAVEIDALTDGAAVVDTFEVPGAFEIPLLARDLAATARYQAVVGCALVVDGGIYRHEFVAQAVVSGLMQVQLDSGVPVLSVVLTPQDFNDTEERRRFFLEHLRLKGCEAAGACVSLLNVRAAVARLGGRE